MKFKIKESGTPNMKVGRVLIEEGVRYYDTEYPYDFPIGNYFVDTFKCIPSFCDISSSAATVSNTTLDILKPFIPNRNEIIKWIDSLLANQFTMKEILSSVARKAVGRLQRDMYI